MQETSLIEGAMKDQIHKDFTDLVYQTREKKTRKYYKMNTDVLNKNITQTEM